MSEPLRLLLVEDSPSDAALVLRALGAAGFDVTSKRVQRAEALREALASEEWGAVISDWSMPEFSGLAALEIVKASKKDVPFILASGTVGEELAVQAMRAGAQDYVLKDRLARLGPALRRELNECRDRQERRRAEQALRDAEHQQRQSQKMEVVGRLAGAVAHDFNNLLVVIVGYSTMMLRDAVLDPETRGELVEINEAGKRASALTRQLSLLSRQQVLSPEELDLNEVIAGVQKMLGRLIGETIELVAELGDDLGGIFADLGCLEQVLVNLVVNARDAMPRGGRITVATRNAESDDAFIEAHPGAPRGPLVVLSVSDTGTGISKDVQSKIFEPFFTTKARGKGTGLGLSTVLGIVREAGGGIGVRSEVGVGTTFEIGLPRITRGPRSAGWETSAEEAEHLRGDEAILVVEDDPAVRRLACDILRRAGYRTLEAPNPVDALELSRASAVHVDLILSDVVMPQMSGPELAAALEPLRPGICFVCMSGYTDDTVVRHGMIDSTIPFVQKPFTPQQLLEKIREALDGE